MDWTRYYLGFETRHGMWTVRLEKGRYWVFFNDERLQGYASPIVAVEELAGGTCNWPGALDPGSCGISDEITQWGRFVLR